MPSHAVAIVSGGMDSAVLLADLRQTWADQAITALSFNYGQRHNRELTYASKLCAKWGIEHKLIFLPSWGELLRSSSLTNLAIQVPHGHYEEESMKVTVVPNRNMIMLSIAASIVMDRVGTFDLDGTGEVHFGAHAGDHAIYPDCREEFVFKMNRVLEAQGYPHIRIHAPFLNLTKADIVTLGVSLKVPFKDTWSCYEGGTVHCGKCGTCVERREAFEVANVPDPTVYR